MSNVRAGVAYVDVRLGAVDQFKQALKREIEAAGRTAGKSLGQGVAQNLAKTTKTLGTVEGRKAANRMSTAFFRDSATQFGRGLKSLATGKFSQFAKDVSLAGRQAATGFVIRFSTMKQSLGNIFKGIGANASAMVSGVSRSFAAVNAKLTSFSKALTSIGQRIGFLGFQLTNLGFLAATAFTAPVGAALAFSSIVGIKTAASLEQAKAALKSLTPAGYNVEALIKRLQKLAIASPVFNTTDVVTFTQRMVAAGLSVKDTEAFLSSFGNIALTTGADISLIPNALEAFVQMVAKGKVSMQELRLQLGNSLPGAMHIVAQALGVTTDKLYAMVEAGDLSSKDLIKALTKLGSSGKFLQGASNGAQTLASKWQALKESIQTKLGNVFLDNIDTIKASIDKLGPSFDKLINLSKPIFKSMIDDFGKFVDKIVSLIDWYSKLDPKQRNLLNKFVLILAVAGPLVIIIGSLVTAFSSIVAAIGFLISPAGLVVGAVLLIVGAFIYFWNTSDKFKNKIKSLWESIKKNLIDPLKGPLMKTWNDIKSAFKDLVDTFSKHSDEGKAIFKTFVAVLGAVGGVIYGVIKGVISAIGPLFKAIVSLIKGVVKIISGIISFWADLFTGKWDKLGKDLRKIWDGLWDAIVGTLVNLGKALWNLVKGIVSGIVDFFKWLWDTLVGHSIIPDMVKAIINWFKSLVNKGINFFKSLGRWFTSFYGRYVQPFVNAVIDGGRKVFDWFKSLPGKIKDAVSGIVGWLYDAGKNLIQGMINGVTNMAKTLADKAKSVVKGAVNAAKNLLGIKSPSRVFMQLGKYTVEGFIQGIEGKADHLASSTAKTFNNAVPAFKPAYGSPANAVGAKSVNGGLHIENYYANDNVDPWRQAEDWYFIVSSRGGVA